MKTSTREEKLRNATTSDQVTEEVVLEVVKVSEEEFHKIEVDARIQLVLETSVEIFSVVYVERDIKLQRTIVQEKINEEEMEALVAAIL